MGATGRNSLALRTYQLGVCDASTFLIQHQSAIAYHQYQDAIPYGIATLHADKGEQGAIAYHKYRDTIVDKVEQGAIAMIAN